MARAKATPAAAETPKRGRKPAFQTEIKVPAKRGRKPNPPTEIPAKRGRKPAAPQVEAPKTKRKSAAANVAPPSNAPKRKYKPRAPKAATPVMPALDQLAQHARDFLRVHHMRITTSERSVVFIPDTAVVQFGSVGADRVILVDVFLVDRISPLSSRSECVVALPLSDLQEWLDAGCPIASHEINDESFEEAPAQPDLQTAQYGAVDEPSSGEISEEEAEEDEAAAD